MTVDEKLVDLWENHERSLFYKELENQLKLKPNQAFEGILLISNVYEKSNFTQIADFLGNVKLENRSKVECLFFYLHWFIYDTQTHRYDEAIIILSKMATYIDDTTPKALHAEYIIKSSILAKLENPAEIKQNTASNRELGLTQMKRGLSLITIGSPQYKRNVGNLADGYASIGSINNLEKKFTDQLPPSFKDMFFFNDAIERGDTKKATELIKSGSLDNLNIPEPLKVKLNFARQLLNIYLKKEIKDHKDDFLLSIQALFDHKPLQALEYAKRFHINLSKNKSILTNLLVIHLIRTELANKNLNAALRLIESQSILYVSSFSELYYARIELLKGNQEKAILHFTKGLKQCKDRDAMGRFDLELELALELTPGNVRILTEGATQLLLKNKITKVSPPILTSQVNPDKGIQRVKGESHAINSVKDDIIKYAALDIPVLILGETGVGKDVIANAIHEESSRSSAPFLAINCSAIAENLLQSELFGHEAGAYTGATKAHKVFFEEAGKGTVFLDEIGDISSNLQAILLRILESGEYRPVGSAKPRPAHCRIIAATNATLDEKIDNGTFRKDLMYRLKRLVIHVPPLRNRPVDIIYLAEYFANLNRVSSESAMFSDEFKDALQKYSWPGNVRELKNEIEKIRLLNSDSSIYSIEHADFLKELKSNKNEITKEIIEAEPNKLNKTSKLDDSAKKKSINEILQNSGSYFRRLEYIKDLFTEHKRLTRKEVCLITEVPNLTIGRDLKKLREENFILKIEPTKSARTHYFILNENA